MSKICNMDWKWPSPSPPPLELFRKFIRFGVATRPYILHASQNIEFSELKMIVSRCLHKTASTLPIDLMLEVRVLIAIILNLKGHFQRNTTNAKMLFEAPGYFFSILIPLPCLDLAVQNASAGVDFTFHILNAGKQRRRGMLKHCLLSGNS